jgi:hypothetical protein
MTQACEASSMTQACEASSMTPACEASCMTQACEASCMTPGSGMSETPAHAMTLTRASTPRRTGRRRVGNGSQSAGSTRW